MRRFLSSRDKNFLSLVVNFVFLYVPCVHLFFLSLCNFTFCCMGVTEVLNKGENLSSSPRVGCHDQDEPFLISDVIYTRGCKVRIILLFSFLPRIFLYVTCFLLDFGFWLNLYREAYSVKNFGGQKV